MSVITYTFSAEGSVKLDYYVDGIHNFQLEFYTNEGVFELRQGGGEISVDFPDGNKNVVISNDDKTIILEDIDSFDNKGFVPLHSARSLWQELVSMGFLRGF